MQRLAAEEYDGEELATMKKQRLRRLLRETAADEVVLPLLAARDAWLASIVEKSRNAKR